MSVSKPVLSSLRSAPVTPSHDDDVAGDCGPMTQQDTQNAHGHDMHQQKLVRLVGCHDVSARRPEDDAEHLP
jgi:hypothetical protein